MKLSTVKSVANGIRNSAHLQDLLKPRPRWRDTIVAAGVTLQVQPITGARDSRLADTALLGQPTDESESESDAGAFLFRRPKCMCRREGRFPEESNKRRHVILILKEDEGDPTRAVLWNWLSAMNRTAYW